MTAALKFGAGQRSFLFLIPLRKKEKSRFGNILLENILIKMKLLVPPPPTGFIVSNGI